MKAPIHKRWWFWVVLVFLILFIALDPVATLFTQKGLDA